MKVEFKGMGSYQGSPVAGSYAGGQLTGSYLVVSYLARLENGDGDASVAQYFLIYNPGTDSWRDAHNPSLPLLVPVTLDLRVRVEITEVFRYPDRPEVRTVFGGWATATNLAGTQLNYTQLQPVPGDPGQQPLTMQAAQELIVQGETTLALAAARPYLNFAAFPPAQTASQPALDLMTGAVYVSDGANWGTPIGYAVTKAMADALDARLDAVEAGQGGGLIGYATRALLNADLSRPAGTVGYVASDPTPGNNGEYLKTGASGAGAWIPASTSRLALVEASTSSNASRLSAVEASGPENLASDAFNRSASVLGIVAEGIADRLINTGSLTIVPSATGNNPYPHPALGTTGAGGRRYSLADLGLIAGNTMTGVLEVYHAVPAPGISVGMIFRTAAGAAVGDVTSPDRVTAAGLARLTVTKAVPAGAATVELYPVRNDTSPVLLLRFGLFRGTRGAVLSEDHATRESVRALAGRVAQNEAALVSAAPVESQVVVTGNFADTPLPGLAGVGGNAYGAGLGAGFFGWGKLLTLSAQANAIRLYPANLIADGTSVEVQVRASAAANAAILARGAVDAAVWNAALGGSAPVTVGLSADVPAGQVLVLYHAFGQRLSHMTGGTGAGVDAARYYYGSVPASFNTAAMGTAGPNSVYLQPLYAADYSSRRYAKPLPGSGSGGGASVGDALAAVYGPADILLPSQISVLKRSGEQFSLYSRQLTTGQWFRSGLIDYDGTYGQQLGGDGHENDGWRLEPNGIGKGQPAPAGTFTLTASIKDAQFGTVKTASSTVTVVDPAANQTPIRVLCIGDSITYRGQWQAQVVTLGNVTLQGIRQMSSGGFYGEGRGGWKLDSATPDAQGGYFQAGTATGNESPFMFPVGVAAGDYRGSTEFWKRALSVAKGETTYPAYDFGGYDLACKEGGAAYQYGVNGYPLSPQNGWVIFDPSQPAGTKFQTWNGAAWVALGAQPAGWVFDAQKYVTRYAWAFAAGLPTHVIFMAGTNDWFGLAALADALATTPWINKYQTAVDSFHALGPSLTMIVNQIPMPSTQGGIGNAYGAGQTVERLRLTYQTVNRALLTRFDTATMRASKIHVSLFGAGIDPHWGATLTAATTPNKYVVNTGIPALNQPYAPKYALHPTDGIHPGVVGMAQGGDWVAATVQATR